jgi:hypothetical protein
MGIECDGKLFGRRSWGGGRLAVRLGGWCPLALGATLMAYDTRCFDLAEIFLADDPALKDRARDLAQHIQTEIEDWIAYERSSLPSTERDK